MRLAYAVVFNSAPRLCSLEISLSYMPRPMPGPAVSVFRRKLAAHSWSWAKLRNIYRNPVKRCGRQLYFPEGTMCNHRIP
jgi:hypothetical protein